MTQQHAPNLNERKDIDAAIIQLASIVESSGDAIFGETLQGVITSWNSSAEKLFGYTADEVLGKPHSLMIPPDLQKEVVEIAERLMEGEAVKNYETTRVRKDGTPIEVSVTVSPIRDPNGRIFAASTIVHDITEQKRMIEELATRSRELERSNKELATRSRELERSNEKLATRTHELERSNKELATRSRELEGSNKELAIRSHELEGSVEELATRSRELERSSAQLAAIVEYSGEAIIGKTLQGIVTVWNNRAEKLFGYTAAEIIGKSISLIIPPDRQQELPQILAQVAAGETVQSRETTRVRKDGTPIEVSITVSPIRDATGRITSASTITHDITEQKRMIEELIALNSALEEANRVRDQFLSTMSHELRTPLTSIIGFTEMLLDDVDIANFNQQQHIDLERILKNGEHLLSLINDVLDLTKIEAGRMVVTYSQVDVRELLTSVVEETQSLASARDLVLRAEVEDGMDFLESNPLKLRQVLLNLVSNALKFTEQGEVTVSARRVTSPGQEGERVALAVKDSGIGIPADIQVHVFEAFYQADGTYTRKAGGTGLGLSIVSQLTTLLGGTIAVTSAPGQGSTFTVMLPIKAVHHSIEQDLPRLHAAQQADASTVFPSSGELPPAMIDALVAVSAHGGACDGQNHLILAVDDNPDVIVLIKAALKGTTYSVVGLQDSLQAMELVQELHPCAIMLDVMMPKLNGWQLLHQLKENPETASIPVMMITVLTEPATGYVLGADAYLIKPFKTTVLLNTLRNLLTSQQGRSHADEREAQPV